MRNKKKNAFTLIELLAVIVILAIIALIATPIILGIVEDARKDSFMRSVELVVGTTDIDVINKLTKDGFEYTLMDGKIMIKEISGQSFSGYEIENVDACVDFLVDEYGNDEEEAISVCNNEPHPALGMTLTEQLASGFAPQEAIDGLKQAGAIKEIYENNYMYTELNLVKNTDAMNGNIIYDSKGNDTYAIHNGKYCVMKKEGMKKAEIIDYVEGDCTTLESKSDFFKRVELLISETNSDVTNKLMDNGYEYTLIDGKINENKTFVGYEILSKNACIDGFLSKGAPMDLATSMCNDEPQDVLNGMTLTESLFADENSLFSASDLLVNGVIKSIYNYDELNLNQNIEDMNGLIQYNVSGKITYAIHNGRYCVIKKANMGNAEITNYEDGKCNIDLTFQEFVDMESSTYDKATSGDGQLIDLGEYGIRYQGKAPNNYVYFNCSDYNNQTNETCETWRIVGIVDDKVKIVRPRAVTSKAWDNPDGAYNNGDEENDWNNSTLKTYLNENYLTSLLNKNTYTGDLISPSTWYLRAHDTAYVTKTEMYELERNTGIIIHDTPYIENTKIGLLYPSDIGFASMENGMCLATTILENNDYCFESNWLDQIIEVNDNIMFLITPSPGSIFVFHSSRITSNWNIAYPQAVYPTLYLSSNVYFEGEGTLYNPFRMQLR